jgi:hypothetical protein
MSAIKVGPINWLKLANIPGYEQIYTGDIDEDSADDGAHVYIILGVINKNKSPERHEWMILCAHGGQVDLVERQIDRTDFHGHVGKVTVRAFSSQQLHASIMLDIDPKAPSKFPAWAFLIDGNARQDPKTYKV